MFLLLSVSGFSQMILIHRYYLESMNNHDIFQDTIKLSPTPCIYTMKNGNDMNNLSISTCEKDLCVYVDNELDLSEFYQKCCK